MITLVTTKKKFCAIGLVLVFMLATSIMPSEAARRSGSSSSGEFGDLFNGGTFSAPSSKAWRDTLKNRTAKLWVDAQFLDELVLNARARIEITWLPRSLLRLLDRDKEVDEWVRQGLNVYYSNDSKVKAKLKGRDVIAVNFRTQKTWSFAPTEIQFQVGNSEPYQITVDDLLWKPDLDALADLPSGITGTLYMVIPSPKAGSKLKISLGPDSVDFELPKK